MSHSFPCCYLFLSISMFFITCVPAILNSTLSASKPVSVLKLMLRHCIRTAWCLFAFGSILLWLLPLPLSLEGCCYATVAMADEQSEHMPSHNLNLQAQLFLIWCWFLVSVGSSQLMVVSGDVAGRWGPRCKSTAESPTLLMRSKNVYLTTIINAS